MSAQLHSKSLTPIWDDSHSENWPPEFEIVSIPNSETAEYQNAYLLQAKTPKRPLIISLHTWSGGYTQRDPLAAIALREDWNYCHPDFQGRNNHPKACLSKQVMQDLRNALDFALQHTTADSDSIFIVGASGGGHATLGAYLAIDRNVKGFLSWVPISDLEAWYWQSLNRQSGYADDVLKCTSVGGDLNINEARNRSPLYWQAPNANVSRLEIFAGIEDGYTGSVPTSHSILFFNKMAHHFGYPDAIISELEQAAILSRALPDIKDMPAIENRLVKFFREIPTVSLTIFQGGHEMLPHYCFSRMKALCKV